MKVDTRGGEGINWLARQVAVPWDSKGLPVTVVQYHKAALFISHDQPHALHSIICGKP